MLKTYESLTFIRWRICTLLLFKFRLYWIFQPTCPLFTSTFEFSCTKKAASGIYACLQYPRTLNTRKTDIPTCCKCVGGPGHFLEELEYFNLYLWSMQNDETCLRSSISFQTARFDRPLQHLEWFAPALHKVGSTRCVFHDQRCLLQSHVAISIFSQATQPYKVYEYHRWHRCKYSLRVCL